MPSVPRIVLQFVVFLCAGLKCPISVRWKASNDSACVDGQGIFTVEYRAHKMPISNFYAHDQKPPGTAAVPSIYATQAYILQTDRPVRLPVTAHTPHRWTHSTTLVASIPVSPPPPPNRVPLATRTFRSTASDSTVLAIAPTLSL